MLVIKLVEKESAEKKFTTVSIPTPLFHKIKKRIEVWIENWEQEDWSPGTYNLTLQVAEEDGTATTRTSWQLAPDLG